MAPDLERSLPEFWSALAYVAVVALVMSYVVLPLVGLKPIPQSSGWLPMFVMHAAYGLGLAAVAYRGTRGIAVVPEGRRRTEVA